MVQNRRLNNAHKSITLRRIYAQLLRRDNTSFGTCACCGTPWSHVDSYGLNYSGTSGFIAICTLCFNDESVSYDDLIIYYTNHIYKENGLTKEEKLYITQSLENERKTNPILDVKYLKMNRERKIDSIL